MTSVEPAVVMLASWKGRVVWKGFEGTPAVYGRHRPVGLDRIRLNSHFLVEARCRPEVVEGVATDEVVQD